MKDKKYLNDTKIIDITGKRYGKLTVIAFDYEKTEKDRGKSNQKFWFCDCDCGTKMKSISRGSLNSGHTTSCGCIGREKSRSQGLKNRQVNSYDLTGEYGIGYTNKGDEFYFDLEDYDKIKDYCWAKNNDGYLRSANRNDIGKSILLHKLITNTNKDEIIDHANQKKNDCRKENLRRTTIQLNSANKKQYNSGEYIGIEITKCNTYSAYLTTTKDGVTKRLRRTFKRMDEAVIQRLKWEAEFFGDFAPQRHLFPQYGIEVGVCVPTESTVAETLLNQD